MIMKNIKFSIVVPYFNSSKFFKETYFSLKDNFDSDTELVIVNDGSNEEETNFLVNLVEDCAYTRIFSQVNKGPSSARNYGVNHANGTYIIFIDADDLMAPEAIKVFRSEVNNYQDYDVFISDVEYFGEKNEYKKQFAPTLQQILKSNPIVVNACVKKSLFDEGLVFMDELNRLGLEDWEWWINTIKNGKKIKHINNSLFKIRVSNQSRTFETANHNLEKIKSVIFGKHGSTIHNNYCLIYNDYKKVKKMAYLHAGYSKVKSFLYRR